MAGLARAGVASCIRIDQWVGELRTFSRELHADPELAYEEHRSACVDPDQRAHVRDAHRLCVVGAARA
ncbi:hypothetical protein [Streptomyces sp. NPDC058385]|uniref:hypothetical protein n=1 Tax=Streptomyces sp. NPDC058385 TaxID=3346473 RepID=UPI0036502EA0